MRYFIDAIYIIVLLLLAPWLIYQALRTGKYRRGLWQKIVGQAFLRAGSRRCIWFHAVSVGEIHLLRQVVACFRRRFPEWECVVSTTTDTGWEEGRKSFPDLPVFYWPLDFSWAVQRALKRVQPDLVVLAEGELWPNFLLAAKRQEIPVAVINGRMSPQSLQRYRRLGALLRRPLFTNISLFAVQTEEYAAAFHKLGVSKERIHVTGSVKYDGATADRGNSRTQQLRSLFAVQPEDLIWVSGSTQAPEEFIVLDIYRRLREKQPRLRLFLVPRQRERFEEVAGLLQHSGFPFLRRSQMTGPITDSNTVVLMDTIGELGALWGLADVAFVGGSLDGRRGGQNMIEPAAYGAAVVFGPHVWNFRQTAANLVAAGAAIQIADAISLQATIERLFADEVERQRLGTAARQFILSQQGATERTVALLEPFMFSRQHQAAA